ncbi:Rft protein-domain-containing protein [Phascolomyces articulosus]|uniref:Man(5)GlcNAc(2)-PP-dolichol translocation protein RFT1 n=1 Tax=Phascolomyces articulosus TaxID=60185 RepID=A0AAD5JZ67_9FUNG|nr:Rft protein-domain-containing protein [Phascolomyces articulosus]
MDQDNKKNSNDSKQPTLSDNNSNNNDDLLASSAKGAGYLVLLQFASRMLTFGLHQIVLRYTTAETLGIASVKLELLLSTILFISREGFRCALLRGDDNNDKSDNKIQDRRDNNENTNEQKVTNLAYIPTIIGLVTTCLACGYYLSTIDTMTASKYPYYRTSVMLFGTAAFAELLVEPLFVLAMNRLYFQLRVSVEGVAVLLRCFITFGLTLAGASKAGASGHNAYGVLAFAVAQLAFGLTMMMGYLGFFFNKVRQNEIQVQTLYPRKLKTEDGRSYWFDTQMLNLASTLTKQSLLKHVLTEGDKMLISALSTDDNQGVYAFVVNYGSLIVRILFQPLEEASRTFFSKLLATKNTRNTKTAKDVILLMLRFHVMLGLLFICFATNYTATLIDLLVGKEWSTERNAPGVLSAYCLYVPIMGINGVTEAFVQAAASKNDLTILSYYMIVFSTCFMASGYLFMSVLDMGAIGLVLANMVNLSIRIAYSWNYIRRYFQNNSKKDENDGGNHHRQQQPLEIRQWFPSTVTIAAFVGSWAITRWSEETIGWETFYQKMTHITIGGLCFLGVAGTT